jgi:hypothetical protein
MRALKGLFLLAVAVLLCSTASAQLPLVASYPSIDSGWSLSGNVAPISCGGSPCKWFLPDVTGVPTVFPRTIGTSDNAERQANEQFTVRSNGQPSWANLLVNVPAFGYYTIAVDVQGASSPAPLGGQSVYPKINLVVNGSNINFCHYPNNTVISPTTEVLVNNPKGVTLEYASSCQMTLFAGNNTIGVQIAGGQGYGGILTLRHMLVYLTSGVTGNTMCVTPGTGVIHDAALSGTDLWALQTTANSWTQTTCGPSSGILPAVNLRTGYYNPGTGCNGSQACALTQMY